MKQFLTVLKFELAGYFKNKGFLITTAIISTLLIIGLSIPSFVNTDNIFGGGDKPGVEEGTEVEEKEKLVIFDKANVIKNSDDLLMYFPNSEWKVASSEEEVKSLVENDGYEAGFIINSPVDYSYVVLNSSFTDSKPRTFNAALSGIARKNYFQGTGINVDEIDALYNAQITSSTEILGKDSISNYAYTNGLIFILYFIIIFYGQLIAVSVTTEKSNRAIEVLVTSTSSNSLIFGKVIGAAIASLVQVGVIIGTALVTYKLNAEAWGGKLDMVFNIPPSVLLSFAVFGMLGYLLYSFLFGVLGALVSKTEDINKTAGPIIIIFVVMFMLIMFSLPNPDSTMMRVLSFVPFSSCMAMFVRIAVGVVAPVEIAISLGILVVSIAFIGYIGAKIYRMGTLMYGNPIKITKALKYLKKSS